MANKKVTEKMVRTLTAVAAGSAIPRPEFDRLMKDGLVEKKSTSPEIVAGRVTGYLCTGRVVGFGVRILAAQPSPVAVASDGNLFPPVTDIAWQTARSAR